VNAKTAAAEMKVLLTSCSPKKLAARNFPRNQDYEASDEDSLSDVLLQDVRKVCGQLATAIRKPTKIMRTNEDVKALKDLVAAK
jgi:hypothetical protein